MKWKQSFTSVLCCVTLTIQELGNLNNGKNKQHILVSYSLKPYKKTAVLITNDFGDRRLVQLMKFIKSWIKILSLTSRCEMQNNQHFCACAMTLECIGLMTSNDGNNAENFLVMLFLFSVYCIKSIFSHPKNQTILDKMFLCLNPIENNAINLHFSRYELWVGLDMIHIVKYPENAFS